MEIKVNEVLSGNDKIKMIGDQNNCLIQCPIKMNIRKLIRMCVK